MSPWPLTDRLDPGEAARRRQRAQRQLAASLPASALRDLHRLDFGRHLLVLARVLLLAGVSIAVLLAPWRWLWPLAVALQGSVLFAFTVLLHEVVHQTVLPPGLRRRHRWLSPALAWLYALPAGLSPTQFRRWHLDHHRFLGAADVDPKRAHLSPKRNRRWLKGLYFTPLLFVIYGRAAQAASRAYPPSLQRRIAIERGLALLVQLLLLLAWSRWGGWGVALRIQIAPLFLAFPLWFAINRLGQHYAIQPDDPAGWTTRMGRSGLWEFLFLWSNFHQEHHAFPRVPFYRLADLHQLSEPFAARRGLVACRYRDLLWSYLVRNEAPHSPWRR